MVGLACAAAIGLAPATSRADPQRDRGIGMGLTLGSLAPVMAGGGLLGGASMVESRQMRVRLYAAGVPTLVAGVGMFGAGLGFFGRYNASRRREPWPLGKGAAAAYLTVAATGMGLVALGAYPRLFVEQGLRRNNRLRGLGLAGIIVGANMAFFGTFLGAYTLGQLSYDGPVPAAEVGRRRFVLSFSGRF